MILPNSWLLNWVFPNMRGNLIKEALFRICALLFLRVKDGETASKKASTLWELVQASVFFKGTALACSECLSCGNTVLKWEYFESFGHLTQYATAQSDSEFLKSVVGGLCLHEVSQITQVPHIALPFCLDSRDDSGCLQLLKGFSKGKRGCAVEL